MLLPLMTNDDSQCSGQPKKPGAGRGFVLFDSLLLSCLFLHNYALIQILWKRVCLPEVVVQFCEFELASSLMYWKTAAVKIW